MLAASSVIELEMVMSLTPMKTSAGMFPNGLALLIWLMRPVCVVGR